MALTGFAGSAVDGTLEIASKKFKIQTETTNLSSEFDKAREPWQGVTVFTWKSDYSLGEGDHRNCHDRKSEDTLLVVSRRPVFSFACTANPLRSSDVIR
jgi:hypothetical protein